jgi:hypothetical protein
MPIYKETSNYYGHGLGDMNNALGQYTIGTGRSANPDQTYGMAQGMLSPLLQYDLARRKQQQQMAMWWKERHDARRAQPSAFESMFKNVLGGGMAGMSMYNQYQSGQSNSALTGLLQNMGSQTAAHGGTINEPIVGQGLMTGKTYSFGEEGPETVTPMDDGGDDFWSMFQGKKKVDEQQQPQQQQQGQGGQSQMSPTQMLSIAQKTPLNKYLGPLASKTGPQATQASGYGATSTPAYSSAYLAPEAGGMAAGEAGLGAATGAEAGGAAAGGEAMAGMTGGTGGASGGIGGLGAGAGIGAIIAAAIAGQHALSRNTGTRVDPSSGERLEKGSPGYYEGTKTSDVFGGHFGTEPWLAFLHDKMNMSPTVGEQFDAASMKDKVKLGPALMDYWANPGGTWAADIGEKLLGDKMGKTARKVINPLGEILKKIF